jgi:hypothetical protein
VYLSSSSNGGGGIGTYAINKRIGNQVIVVCQLRERKSSLLAQRLVQIRRYSWHLCAAQMSSFSNIFLSSTTNPRMKRAIDLWQANFLSLS